VSRAHRSFGRRSLGIALALSPFLLAIAALVVETTPSFPRAGYSLTGLALFLAASNFWNAALRPHLWHRRYGHFENYRNVSPVPALATILAMAGCLVSFGATAQPIMALIALAIDFGGLPWFIVAIWNDTSFWDA
jgi:hypothetical protein